MANTTMKWTGRYGVPYRGSKNRIAKEVLSCIPSGKRFVDLFAGGCAMTHCALCSGRYEQFAVNDTHHFGNRLFHDAIRGLHRESWHYWMERDEFNERKSYDPYASLCWSFSNNGDDYIYGYDVADKMREKHYEYCRTRENPTINITRGLGLLALEKLNKLKVLDRTTWHNIDYSEYKYFDGDVVYCDPPYESTRCEGYGHGREDFFESPRFWEWARSRDFPVFVSEYKAPADFVPIYKTQLAVMCGKNIDTTHNIECLFVHERYAQQYQTDLFSWTV